MIEPRLHSLLLILFLTLDLIRFPVKGKHKKIDHNAERDNRKHRILNKAIKKHKKNVIYIYQWLNKNVI